MNIINAIKERRSVRTYDETPIPESVINELQECIRSVYNPFGGHFTINIKKFDLKNGFKPSTYGMVKGADTFFTIGIDNEEVSALATGFCFEQVVLSAWQKGLGTCWIAATFKGTDFENENNWPAGQALKIVSPVGYPAKKSLVEKIARFAVGSQKRKPFEDLFFTDNFKKSLPHDNEFSEALEMLRLAPSSTNSQPWRVLVDDNTVHFYYVPKSPLAILDTGIGICHFYETEHFYGRPGEFFISPEPPAGTDKLKYLVSYKSTTTKR